MVHAVPSDSCVGNASIAKAKEANTLAHRKKAWRRFILLASVAFLAPLLLAQGNPQVTSVDPPSGKVNDSVTIAGENLGKGTVAAVFLSDDKNDYKATIVDQSADKIVMKVPQVKAGNYNISVQAGNNILIKPVRFTVEE